MVVGAEVDSKLSFDLEMLRDPDSDVLGQVFLDYSAKIYGYCRKCGLPEMDAEHVVGDVFSRLIIACREGNGPITNLNGYLFQIAYNLIVDQSRIDNRENGRTISVDENSESLPGAGLPIEDQMEIKLMIANLNQHLKQLTPKQQEVLRLWFGEDMKVRQIAEKLNLSPGAVKGLKHRAIKSLRDLMGEAGVAGIGDL